jgi:haloacetate dehalogenase
MCEDYRAGASIDRRLDLADKTRDAKITAPLLFVWSKSGFPATTGDHLSLWKAWTQNLSAAQKSIADTLCQKRTQTLFWLRQSPS